MASINVTYDQMTQAATDLSNGKDRIVDDLTRLRTMIDGLVANGFVTERASGTFQATYEKFTKGATTTVESLTELANFLRNAANALRETDEALNRAIQQ